MLNEKFSKNLIQKNDFDAIRKCMNAVSHQLIYLCALVQFDNFLIPSEKKMTVFSHFMSVKNSSKLAKSQTGKAKLIR